MQNSVSIYPDVTSGIPLQMRKYCVVCKSEQKFFWTKRPILETPFFSKIMSYRRFVLIKKYLHFSYNDAYYPYTHPQPKLNKI
ncbi:hypothetical protein J437_LFUL004466 [Ladona fulva]|uniref:PiggyBac transposable element-derived protein domain-containing protein n=1 Tax=Ladona fulva TaxID=123851 RepID=A0A8K0K158_LADFU|nr:hypothetical protein J437_LFUL004466 [Ladona fulva]